MNVSILTVTQYKRYDTLCLLADNILGQTYKDILEWVIVEASSSKIESDENKERLEKLRDKMSPIEIVILPYEENAMLGRHRNRGNDACRGDIIICMDDDDYYFENRIEVSVKALKKNKNILICGSTDMLMYDMIVKRLYQFRNFGDRHSTNNCMSYKKEYLKTHRYVDNKKTGEEEEFTNKFTEPMVQIDPYSCIIQFSHSHNTYNKRDLVVKATLGMNMGLVQINNVPIKSLIDEELLEKYNRYLLTQIESVPYDIIYFTGGLCFEWSPYDDNIGGSEQAIVELSKEWVKQGQRVAVYTVLKNNSIMIKKDGVDYYSWKEFPYHATRLPNIILWRMSGIMYFFPFTLTFKSVMIDLHDLLEENTVQILHDFKNVIRKILFKSEFHKSLFNEISKRKGYNFDSNQLSVIPNGIRTEMLKYEPDKYENRQKYRFCYTSCYTRGLGPLLLYTWPIIYRHEPLCELHVYYGMDYITQNEAGIKFKESMQKLLSTPGVMDHGKQSINIIKREKHISNFHLYVTSTVAETDCIAIKESLALGCIPIISNENVFKERDGIHIDIDKDDVKSYEKLAIEILKLLRMDKEILEDKRKEGRKSKTLITWKQVSNEWLSVIYPV